MNKIQPFAALNITAENCSKKCSQSSSSSCQLLKYCNSRSGAFENPLCRNTTRVCATLYAANAEFNANHLIEAAIIGLNLPLQIVWLGTKDLEKFIFTNIESVHPILFYWWSPTAFFSAYKDKIVKVNLPEAFSFRSIDLYKYVSIDAPQFARAFVSRFKMSQNAVDAMLVAQKQNPNYFTVACNFLSDDSNLQPLLAYIPAYETTNTLRISVNSNSISSIIIGRLIQVFCEDDFGTNVDIILSNNDLESMDYLMRDKVDLVSEVFQQEKNRDTNAVSSQYNFYPVGTSSTIQLLVSIPKHLNVDPNSVSHWLYSNTLVPYLPRVGTIRSDYHACLLWFCKDGRYIPEQCEGGKQTNCGEILVSIGLGIFTDNLSILVEIIKNLKLPFVLTFVTDDVLAAALETRTNIVVFLACDSCIGTKKYSKGLPHFDLPAFSDSCQKAIKTTYKLNNLSLGSYDCGFPVKYSHIVAKKNLKYVFPAIYTLIDNLNLGNVDINMIGENITDRSFKQHDVTLGVKQWILKNKKLWSNWIIGCVNAPGKFGVEGKCELCPPGTISPKGSNLCTPCPEGTYTFELNRQKCFKCPLNTVSASNSHGLSMCKCMGQLGNADSGCTPCPLNGLCKMGKLFVPNGFWRFDKVSKEIFKCPKMEACRGVSMLLSMSDIDFQDRYNESSESCLPGHSGVLCDTCGPSFTKRAGLCQQCPAAWVNVTTNLAVSILLVGSIYFWMQILYRGSSSVNSNHSDLSNFRKRYGYDHICIYIRDHRVNHLRLLDYNSDTFDQPALVTTRKNSSARNRRVSRINESIFNLSTMSNASNTVTNTGVPRKIIVSNSIEKYRSLQPCIYEKKTKILVQT